MGYAAHHWQRSLTGGVGAAGRGLAAPCSAPAAGNEATVLGLGSCDVQGPEACRAGQGLLGPRPVGMELLTCPRPGQVLAGVSCTLAQGTGTTGGAGVEPTVLHLLEQSLTGRKLPPRERSPCSWGQQRSPVSGTFITVARNKMGPWRQASFTGWRILARFKHLSGY